MNTFVVMTRDATAKQQRSLADYAFAGLAWWHRLPQSWVVADNTGTLTANDIRNRVLAASPRLTHFVLAVDFKGFSGFGSRDWQEWFKATYEQ